MVVVMLAITRQAHNKKLGVFPRRMHAVWAAGNRRDDTAGNSAMPNYSVEKRADAAASSEAAIRAGIRIPLCELAPAPTMKTSPPARHGRTVTNWSGQKQELP